MFHDEKMLREKRRGNTGEKRSEKRSDQGRKSPVLWGKNERLGGRGRDSFLEGHVKGKVFFKEA